MPGKKTWASFATLVVSAVCVPIDPTGIAAATFIASAAGTVAGAGYHSVRKLQDAMETRRPNNPAERALVNQAEDAIRKLSAAAVGCGIQGTLSLVLPHCLAGLAINGVEGMYRYKELKRVKDSAGGKRQLLKKLSIRNIIAQMVAGTSIKGTSTVLFMGTEFDTWGKNMGLTTVALSDLASSTASAALEDKPFIGPVNDLVSILPNEMKEAMGEIPGTDWTWADSKPTLEVAAVGAAAGISEQAAAIVVEVPLQKAAGRATATRS